MLRVDDSPTLAPPPSEAGRRPPDLAELEARIAAAYAPIAEHLDENRRATAKLRAELLDLELRFGYLLREFRGRLDAAGDPPGVVAARFGEAMRRRGIHAKRAERAQRIAEAHRLGRFRTPSEHARTPGSAGVCIPVVSSRKEALRFSADGTPRVAGAAGDQLSLFATTIDAAREVAEKAARLYAEGRIGPDAAAGFRRAVEAAERALGD